VRLTSSDGASLELRPVAYQFGEDGGWDNEWDPNWLLVHGEVRTAQGSAWSFEDPCLTNWEAGELAEWLREAADGRVPPAADPTDEDCPGRLTFVEPNLGFSVAALDGAEVVLRAHLSAEALASCPLGSPDREALRAHGIALRVGRAHLLAAARDWQSDLTRFPRR
jgi:hypothetical protein